MDAGARIWVTRARPGAEATAARLKALGLRPWVCPLLEVEALASHAPSLEGVGALAFTSANAVRVFAKLDGARRRLVFCVGDATAQAAREVGFPDVRSAQGDVAALATAIVANPPAGEVLHLCAEIRAGELVGALSDAGVAARALVLYRTVVRLPSPNTAPPHDLAAVVLHSPRAAGALAGYLKTRAPELDPQRLDAFGLSAACLAPLRGSGLHSLTAAEAPNDAALLRLLR